MFSYFATAISYLLTGGLWGLISCLVFNFAWSSYRVVVYTDGLFFFVLLLIVFFCRIYLVLLKFLSQISKIWRMQIFMFFLIWAFFFFFFGYVLHVQALCEWRERQIPLLIFFLLYFLCYFLFWEERDIKLEQKYLFTLDFNRGGLRNLNGAYLRWAKC